MEPLLVDMDNHKAMSHRKTTEARGNGRNRIHLHKQGQTSVHEQKIPRTYHWHTLLKVGSVR
jgi:hypothetical protein